MRWFWSRQQVQLEVAQHEKRSSIEVLDIKSKTHASTQQAKKDIDRLNRLLKANGITLKIHIATRGDYHA